MLKKTVLVFVIVLVCVIMLAPSAYAAEAVRPAAGSGYKAMAALQGGEWVLGDETKVYGNPEVVYDGTEQTQAFKVVHCDKTLEGGRDFTVYYKDNVDAGKAYITVRGEGQYSGSTVRRFTIVPADISRANVVYDCATVYTGKPREALIAVRFNGKVLVRGRDFIVSYVDNVEVGSASMVVTGKGNYTGKVTKGFRIAPMSIASASVGGLVDKVYKGKAISQNPTVSLGGKVLKVGTDYTVGYSGNTSPGTATVTVAGQGHYFGTVSATFRIKAADSYKTCLRLTLAALASHKPYVKYPASTVEYGDYCKVIKLVCSYEGKYEMYADRYGLERFGEDDSHWDSDVRSWMVDGTRLVYRLTKSEVTAAEKKVQAIASKARKKGTKAKKIKYVYNYLVKNTAYATFKARWPKIAKSKAYSTYGAIVRHRAFCMGYAVAFVRILRTAGVGDASYLAVTAPGSSSGINHAIAKVGSRYYDVCWGDPNLGNKDGGTKAKVSYKYYKKTKKQMEKLGYRF